MSDGFLEFVDIHKAFGPVKAVDGVTLRIQRGQIFSLLGPSGCGKTTLLRMCAGFETPDRGRVLLDGKDITDLPPNRRQVNTVFQNYALFPHLNVRDNIAFGLKIARRSRREIRDAVDRMLDLVDLADFADKRVTQISGGQKQRVAIARALVNRPQLLLLDEPLAALDLKLRQRMLVELDTIHDEVGITFLYVTHDQGEAMGISDGLAVMDRGRIEQVGTPAEIYEAPKSSFVAAFIGDATFFDGTVAEILDDNYSRMRIESLGDVLIWNDKRTRLGDRVDLSLRPEKIDIFRERPEPHPRVNVVEGEVEEVIYLGSHTKYWVRAGDYRVGVHRQHRKFLLDEKTPQWKDRVWLAWHADDGYMLEKYRVADEELLALPPEESAPESVPDTPGRGA